MPTSKNFGVGRRTVFEVSLSWSLSSLLYTRSDMFAGTSTELSRFSRSADECEWSENLDGFSTFRASSGSLHKRDAASMIWHWVDVPILLALIGLSSALLSYTTKSVLTYNSIVRDSIVNAVPEYLELPVFCFYSVTMALVACSLSQLICKECVGSGLPDMRTILSGVVKPVLLSRRLIVAKTLGLWLSLMAGLSIGREGPFVQVSGAVADQLMKLSPFLHIRRQDSKRLEILACACASGVSATFGNAFGGVLFSIEFTSSAYLVRTLPKAFLTSVVAMLAFLFLGVSDELALFKGVNKSVFILPTFGELSVFFLVGLGGGLLGIVFVYLVEVIVTARNSVLDENKHSP
jgi:H+/Cl- antiporter ClcA